MVKDGEREIEVAVTPATPPTTEVTKAQLQRRMDDARESISHTVAEIKNNVEDQYATVKETVSGILDWREQFRSDPIVWSIGSLSAGFALGYTLGYARKSGKSSRGKRSELAAFADSFVEEFAKLGNTLPTSSLDPMFKQILGFDLSDMLKEIASRKPGEQRTRPPAKKTKKAKKAPTRKAPKRRPSRRT